MKIMLMLRSALSLSLVEVAVNQSSIIQTVLFKFRTSKQHVNIYSVQRTVISIKSLGNDSIEANGSKDAGGFHLNKILYQDFYGCRRKAMQLCIK